MNPEQRHLVIRIYLTLVPAFACALIELVLILTLGLHDSITVSWTIVMGLTMIVCGRLARRHVRQLGATQDRRGR